MRFLSNTR